MSDHNAGGISWNDHNAGGISWNDRNAGGISWNDHNAGGISRIDHNAGRNSRLEFAWLRFFRGDQQVSRNGSPAGIMVMHSTGSGCHCCKEAGLPMTCTTA